MAAQYELKRSNREVRLSLGHVSNRLNRHKKRLRRSGIAKLSLSLFLLTSASTAFVAVKPSSEFKDMVARLLSPAMGKLEASPDQKIAEIVAAKPIEPKAPSRVEARDQTASAAAEASDPAVSKPFPALANGGLPAVPAFTPRKADPVIIIQPLPTVENDASQTDAASPAPAPPPVTVKSSPYRGSETERLVANPEAWKSADASSSRDVGARESSVPPTMFVDRATILDRPPPSASPYTRLAISSSPEPKIACVQTVRDLAKKVTIYFGKGASSVPFKEMQGLRDFASAVAACGEVKIDVCGHTDKSGENLSNLQLSWQRAETVIKAIRSLGGKEEQFSPVGYSATRPVSTDKSAEALALNRRVDFLVR